MLDVKLISKGREAVVYLSGKLDTLSSPEAEQTFKEMAKRFEKIDLDLRDLNYISSAGLRVIKLFHVDMIKGNGELFICNTPRNVMEIFELTGFSGLLKFKKEGK